MWLMCFLWLIFLLLRRYSRNCLESELAIPIYIGHDVIPDLDIPLENSQRQRIRQQLLDRPLQGARSERRIVAFLEQGIPCRRR